MALDTFTPPRPPSEGTGDDIEFDITEAKFGDGYSQRAGNGLNPVRQTYNLVWNRIPAADGQTIIDDLTGWGAVGEAFFWTPPDESTPIKFTVTKINRAKLAGGRMNLSAMLKRVYDQGS